MQKHEPVAFTEAIERAQTRKVVLPSVYYGQLQGVARANAFSIAGVAAMDQLQGVLDNLVKTLIEGGTFREWKEAVTTGKVSLDLPPHRIENIFRTNTQGHYAKGRCLQQKETIDTHPFLLYDAVNDSRTRPTHAAMDGFVGHHTNPVWETWYPPNGYQCRCRVITLTEDQAKQYRDSWVKRVQSDPAIFDEFQAAFRGGPDKGWNYHPCEEGGEVIDRVVEQKKRKVHPKLKDAHQAREARKPVEWEFMTEDELDLDRVKALGATRLDELLSEKIRDDYKITEMRGLPLQEVAEELSFGVPEIKSRLLARLKEVRSIGGAKIATKQKSGKAVNEMKRVGAKVPTSWVTKANKGRLDVTLREGKRAYYRQARGSYDARIATRTGGGASEHEYFHHIQRMIPGLDEVFAEEHFVRTYGEELKAIYPGEYARRDGYVHPYQGREYEIKETADKRAGFNRQGQPREVITMAFQTVLGEGYTENDWFVQMLKLDRTMVELVLGVLFHFRPKL